MSTGVVPCLVRCLMKRSKFQCTLQHSSSFPQNIKMFQEFLICVLLLAAIKPAHSASNMNYLISLRWKLSYALDVFAIDFFDNLPYRLSENIFICPLSITNALSAVYCGSRGDTEEELSDILRYNTVNLTKKQVTRVSTMFSPKFLLGDDTQFYVFNTSNAILINPKSNLNVSGDFQKEMANRFSVALIDVDFYDPSYMTLYSLNQWVISQTRKIRFYKNEINFPADLMVISSAYLKAAWEYEFSPLDTYEETFYNRGLMSGAKSVQMMHMKKELNYYSIGEWLRIIELPFKDRALRMFIFLPKNMNGLFSLENRFNRIFFTELSKLSLRKISVSLPKFELRYSTSMVPSLTELGATELFNPETVDLSEMIENQKVVVGEMVHKTFLSVTEGGLDTTSASAVNSTMSNESMLSFTVNQPFLFIITDRRPRILFMGHVIEL
ncbi:serpin B5 [Nephila pilipes]|uniref:Serpin B5 n=1 Tax=Nephila pilipes TaxID=299642 RepID=A0A8X6Q6M1_NEPPI|nr:serpin B5 [Nephila pilipes]